MSAPHQTSRSTRQGRKQIDSKAANADLFEDSPWSLELAVGNAHQTGGGRAPKLRVIHTPDLAEVLSATEDLWTRMARTQHLRTHVTFDAAEGAWIVLARLHGAVPCEEAQQLLAAAEDLGRYRWMQAGDEKPRSHALVQDVSWAGDALVIELVSMKRIAKHAGADGSWQVQSLMNRLQRVCVATHESVIPKRLAPIADPYAQAMDPEFGAEYWQNQMRALKRHMDALGI